MKFRKISLLSKIKFSNERNKMSTIRSIIISISLVFNIKSLLWYKFIK